MQAHSRIMCLRCYGRSIRRATRMEAGGYELVATSAVQRPPTRAALLRPLRPISVAHRPALRAPIRTPLPTTLNENYQLQNTFKLHEN